MPQRNTAQHHGTAAHHLSPAPLHKAQNSIAAYQHINTLQASVLSPQRCMTHIHTATQHGRNIKTQRNTSQKHSSFASLWETKPWQSRATESDRITPPPQSPHPTPVHHHNGALQTNTAANHNNTQDNTHRNMETISILKPPTFASKSLLLS